MSIKKLMLLGVLAIGGWPSAIAQDSEPLIGWPQEGFYTPYTTQYMVPLNKEVHFHGLPSTYTDDAHQWHWQLPGATPSEADTQEATVNYAEEGIYDVTVTLDSKHQQEAVKGLRAGGAAYIWNIATEEKPKLSTITLGWFGYYGGTNWLGMKKFAEYFHAPGAPAYIDSVAIWFGSYAVATANAELTVSIASKGQDGMPGETIGSTTLSAGNLVKSTTTPTCFKFDQPISVDSDFFVVIEGFPDALGDDVAMLCVRRDYGETCTVYHLLEDEGPNDQPMGTYSWYPNEDDPASFAISPWLRYATGSGIRQSASEPSPVMALQGRTLILSSPVKHLRIVNAAGALMMESLSPSSCVDLSGLPQGVYLIQADDSLTKILIP